MQDSIADSLGIESGALVKADVVETIPNSIKIETKSDFDSNIDEDYEQSRSHLYRLMSKMEELISSSINVAVQSEHPRAYEVAGNLAKVSTDVIEQLAKLNKSTQNLKGIKKANTNTASTITTNNSIFVGSTSELSAFLNSQKNNEHS